MKINWFETKKNFDSMCSKKRVGRLLEISDTMIHLLLQEKYKYPNSANAQKFVNWLRERGLLVEEQEAA